MSQQFKLVSFKLCPFVQRSIITMNEKGVAFDIEYIDLANKPDWFLKLSPLGKVPILQVEGTVLFESAVINEYLDQVTEGSLLPEDPLERAQGRAWIEFASQLVMNTHQLQVGTTAEEAAEHAAAARDKLGKLEAQLPSDGPYFYGGEISLVDTATAPALLRLSWLESYDDELTIFADFPKVSRWRDALLARETVKNSTVPEIEELFKASLVKAGSYVGRSLAR